MQTIVSQGGHSLSGGQRQRVAIARAVIKPAEILIFDDATSALDLKTEAELYSNLGKNKKDITKIIIAQRIASVKNADRIVVMDNGKLADVGSHEQLMITSSIYKDIYDSQLKK
jgi:ATP-binding cassette subfamily B multidrug efflux pump